MADDPIRQVVEDLFQVLLILGKFFKIEPAPGKFGNDLS